MSFLTSMLEASLEAAGEIVAKGQINQFSAWFHGTAFYVGAAKEAYDHAERKGDPLEAYVAIAGLALGAGAALVTAPVWAPGAATLLAAAGITGVTAELAMAVAAGAYSFWVQQGISGAAVDTYRFINSFFSLAGMRPPVTALGSSFELAPNDVVARDFLTLSQDSTRRTAGYLWNFPSGVTADSVGLTVVPKGNNEFTLDANTWSNLTLANGQLSGGLLDGGRTAGALLFNPDLGTITLAQPNGTVANFGTGQITAISSTDTGLTFSLAPSPDGVLRSITTDRNTGTTSISVGGITLYRAPAGSTINGTDGRITATERIPGTDLTGITQIAPNGVVSQDFSALGLPSQPSGFNQSDSGNPFPAAAMLTSGSMLGPGYSGGTAGISPPLADGGAESAYPAAQPGAQFPSLLPLHAGQPAIDPANFLGLSPAQEGFDNSFGLLDGTLPLLRSRPPAPLSRLVEGLLQNPWGDGGAAPGNLFDWPQSNPTGYDWLVPPLAPSWTIPQADLVGRVGTLPVPPPQTQMTPQQVPAPPPPFSVPVPPALLPLARHFFPQGLGTNDTQAWPSAGTADDAGVQLNAAGNAGAGLSLAAAGQRPQPFTAPPPPPFGVPVPPALLPLARHFFPQGLGTNDTQAWPSTGTSDGVGTQPDQASSAGTDLDFTRWPVPSQETSASPAPPINVPIPEALRPLVHLFFP